MVIVAITIDPYSSCHHHPHISSHIVVFIISMLIIITVIIIVINTISQHNRRLVLVNAKQDPLVAHILLRDQRDAAPQKIVQLRHASSSELPNFLLIMTSFSSYYY